MEQYIKKFALVAEIERRLWLLVPKMVFHQQRVELEKLLSFINTLEVKEVDLEKEYKNFVEEDPVYNKLVNSIVGKAIAKHFFELGLRLQTETNITFKYNIGESVREYKAQKGEEV